MRFMRRAAASLVILIPFAAAAFELEDGTFLFDDETPVPATVMALETCGAEPEAFATRRPFAGGFMFSIKCPGNNENFMEALFFATDESGADARLLHFRGPNGRRGDFEDTISNVHWYQDKNEIGAIAVDSDPDSRPTPNVCRTESRWRLEGNPPEPKVVYWRETADCTGATGWAVLVGD